MTDRSGASPEGGAPDRSPQGAPAEPGAGASSVESERRRAARAADELRDPHLPAPDLQAAASAPPWAPGPQSPAPSEREYEVPLDTGQLHALPTGQLLTVHRTPVEVVDEEVEEEEAQRRVYSYVAAVIGVIGAAASLFVGWMLPLCIAAIVFGVLGLRREEHARVPAFVGIGSGITGLVFSAVWIGYYAIVFGALPR